MKADENSSRHFQPHVGQYGVLMSDLRGFTAITERYPPLTILPLLNHYFIVMTRIIAAHGGTVDKFMGDSILALFDLAAGSQALRSMLTCAVEMQLTMDEVNQFGRQHNLPEVYMGIGITQGELVICELGAEVYREKTVLGDAVNLVSRVSAFALRGQVLMSEGVHGPIANEVQLGSSFDVHIKGKKQGIKVHELHGIVDATPLTIPVRDKRKTPRVEALLPISYYNIENQRVRSTAVHADIVDLSYGGMRIETPQQHLVLDEVKIVIPFSVDMESTCEAYAKVLACVPGPQGGYCISVEFSYLDESAAKSIKMLVDQLIQA